MVFYVFERRRYTKNVHIDYGRISMEFCVLLQLLKLARHVVRLRDALEFDVLFTVTWTQG